MLSLYPLRQRPTRSLIHELRRNFDDLFIWENPWETEPHQLGPEMEQSETADAFILTAEAPGFKNEDINIVVEKNTLTIEGKRAKAVPTDYKLIREERPQMSFSHQRTLPSGVNNLEISASLKDGVLTVTIPKQEQAKPRKINVIAASDKE